MREFLSAAAPYILILEAIGLVILRILQIRMETIHDQMVENYERLIENYKAEEAVYESMIENYKEWVSSLQEHIEKKDAYIEHVRKGPHKVETEKQEETT